MRLFQNDHMGLIGMNGVGKTTLMNLIAKKLDPDEGRIIWEDDVSFSYLDQHLKVYDDLSVSSYLYKVYEDLFEIEGKINDLYKSLENTEEANYDKILNKAYNLTAILEEKNFYMIKSKIDNVLKGLGIKVDPSFLLKNLSGGQRVKIFLAKMLLEEKDVLLLDEPTNFLDPVHVDWLSKYLSSYPKAFIVISHNRAFLNSVCNVIAEINNKQLNVYKGNYDANLLQKSMNDERYLNEYLSQQKYIKKTEEFIKKNIARASTTKRAQSRRKTLEKLEILEKPTTYKKVKFDFPFTKSFHKEALIVKDLEIGYDKVLLPKINMKLRFGEKVAIIGKNGVGKTTFIKTILGLISAISGKVKLSELNDIVYYSQDFKAEDITAVDFIRNYYPLMENKDIRDLLAKYGIIGDLAIKSMLQLSGGELTKVRFALLNLSQSNLLILDEPTNHLDVLAKEALYKALAIYPGTVILVSHEKDFYKDLKMKEIIFG
jgi:ATPase subunit of ABC transporter with duplicated ATPase domains